MARKTRTAREKTRVFLLGTETKTQNSYILLSIRAALAAHPRVESVTLGSHGTAIRTFAEGEYEIFLGVGGAADNAPLLARLCALAKVSVLWTTEDPYELEANVRLSDVFDIVFTNDLSSVPAYNGRARHLPLAASVLFNDLEVAQKDVDYRYDLLFVGTAWPNRVTSIQAIARAFGSRIRMKVALPYNEFLEQPTLADPDLLLNWRCSNVEFARLANRSRVVLGLQRHFSAASDDQAGGSTPPPRLFEVALAGGFQIHVSNSTEAARYFAPGREFVLCKDDDNQVIAAIEEALATPERRIGIARAARTRAQAEHTYGHRIDHIICCAAKLLAVAPSVRHPKKGLRTLLVVTHNMKQAGHEGGIEVYQESIKNLPANYRILFLFPVRNANEPTLRLSGLNRPDTEYPVGHRETTFTLHDAAVEVIFERIIYEYAVDIVHFQHLLGYPLSLPLIARACGVSVVWTFHDYYLICNRFTLLNFDGRFCDTANQTSSTCDVCLGADGGQPNGSQTRRRNFVSTVLKAIDVIITNTLFTSNYLRAVYPEIKTETARVVEMLLPDARHVLHRSNDPSRVHDLKNLRVVVPGNFTAEKGGHYLIRLFILTKKENIQYTILGRVDPQFLALFEELSLTNVTLRGGYVQSDVLELLDEFHVSLHVSIWPETYMITLSETWSAGLIPIVTALGAQGERVTHGKDGFVVPPHDAAAIAICLRGIQSGEVDLDKVRAAIASKLPVTPAAHIDQLWSIYEGLVDRYEVPPIRSVLRYQRYFSMTAFGAGVRTNTPVWNRGDAVWDEMLSGESHHPSIPKQPAVLLDQLPRRYSHLRESPRCEIMDPGVRWSLDYVGVDGETLTEASSPFKAGQSLRLRGWIHLSNSLDLVESFIEIRNSSICVLSLATREQRPDVAELLGDPRSANSGFDVVIPLSLLPEGLYEINAVLVYDGSIGSARGLGEVRVRHRDTPASDTDWVTDLGLFTEGRPTVRLDSASSSVEIIGAELIDQKLFALPSGSSLRLSGSTAVIDGYGLAPRVAVVLEDIGSQEVTWTLAHRCRRPAASGQTDPMTAYCGFVVDTYLPARIRGTYRLKVLQDFGDKIGVTDEACLFHIRDPRWSADVIADNVDFLLRLPIASVVPETSGFSCFVERVLAVPSLDKSHEGNCETSQRRVEGWMFFVGLGAPRYLLISWQQNGVKLFRKISLLSRRDVYEKIGERAADQSGFVFELPSVDDLETISCLQVYDEGTISFLGFGELVAKAWREFNAVLGPSPVVPMGVLRVQGPVPARVERHANQVEQLA